jgi:hypothetical protein
MFMDDVTVSNVQAVITPIVDGWVKNGQGEKKFGTLIVTPWEVVFQYKTWFQAWEINIYRDELASMVESWRPILFGKPAVRFSTRHQRFEFRLRTFYLAQQVRRILTSPVR